MSIKSRLLCSSPVYNPHSICNFICVYITCCLKFVWTECHLPWSILFVCFEKTTMTPEIRKVKVTTRGNNSWQTTVHHCRRTASFCWPLNFVSVLHRLLNSAISSLSQLTVNLISFKMNAPSAMLKVKRRIYGTSQQPRTFSLSVSVTLSRLVLKRLLVVVLNLHKP